jgi:3-hydroxybutyryl-CoA dehydrogenase
MNYVAVIGTGIMAAGIAAGFLAQSIPVVILGRSKDKADACLDKALTLAQWDLCQPKPRHHQGWTEN